MFLISMNPIKLNMLDFDPPSLHIAVYQSNNSRNVPNFRHALLFGAHMYKKKGL